MYSQDPYGSAGPETPEAPSHSTVLITQEEIDEFLSSDEYHEGAVLGYFETPSHSEDVEVFNKVLRMHNYSNFFFFSLNALKSSIATHAISGC